jgi:hypothetical protein
MRRSVFILTLVAAVVGPGAGVALAQDSSDVAAAVAETGVYVDPASDASEERVGEIVGALRAEGENISIVVLAEEPLAGATTFADAVSNRLDSGLVFVVAPETIGIAGTSEEFGDIEIEEAVEASLDGADDMEVVVLFAASLAGEGALGGPGEAAESVTGTEAGGDSSGGFSFIWLIVLAAVAAVGFLWWRSRQDATKGPRLQPQLADAKEAVQDQINAVANDIIEMEDEVRAADNAQADEFYEAAGRTYGEVSDAFAGATTPEEVLELSNRLDEAIWQLDSAEAALDGKPPPARPEPKRLPVPEQAAPASTPPVERTPGSTLPPRPDYDRRPTRRSGYSGGSLMNLLIGAAGAIMTSRTRRRGGAIGGIGGLAPGRRPTARRVPPPRFPSVPTRSGPSSSSRTSTRTRRGRTGRVRSGGRRRRG